jgi:hypothetical protein
MPNMDQPGFTHLSETTYAQQVTRLLVPVLEVGEHLLLADRLHPRAGPRALVRVL